ncbi:Excinuclease ABC subunit B [Mycoplasmopsis meleagridis]|uniref:UvrABC system protein B n=1 Tax=Mycoplasmopsis meleagridis ATCC 25294 TaxID=1264554 RepID=A0A0F5H1G7_9BACT|nr:excinuclease ABC subunit UvrB [Mycoplasmopsis meleagridis]KKB27023.1 Excinuclease ABC subunit B [Mycoplasmopsis meleagridis ATCC 25294]OAD18371.1 Excinuclease ABC subunit B [Mycoplasmopsis meleagridis]VEU77500.1 UvrABC system protein B [Mycoplasmopsis meleagridis]
MNKYELVSSYQPAGDQPKAINELVNNIKNGVKYQVLEGITGSGKTFTIANVIKEFNRPVLVLSHNKTLASQLYTELKGFFPNNKVEYFVSYFDYYRPEYYHVASDSYSEKVSQNNAELDAMRMSSVNSLLTRNDTIIVASVSAIYGALNPEEYQDNFWEIHIGMKIKREEFLRRLIILQYQRNEIDLGWGTFSSKGDNVFINFSSNENFIVRVEFFGDEIEDITLIDPITKNPIKKVEKQIIFPGQAYTVSRDIIKEACEKIYHEMKERIKYFENNNRLLEAQRIKERTEKDIDSLEEFGICSGIENYALYMDKRLPGQRPYTLLDYFKDKNPLLIIDESHMMIPQLAAMYRGDHARKKTLVEYGFRLPSALDNRPLQLEEFEKYFDFQTIYISATPADYELNKTEGVIIPLYVRPTGLLDPVIEVRKSENQVENIYDEIQKQKIKNERTLILTTTKRLAEELTRYFLERNEKVAYIHSEHKTFERNNILRKLRTGTYDTVIGINLLREGIDLPEVSLIIVLDADKEGFLRSTKSLIQIAGRAARNANGRVIFYADNLTNSMKECIEDNLYKRSLQISYNREHNIIPKTIQKPIPELINGNNQLINNVQQFLNAKDKKEKTTLTKKELIAELTKQMQEATRVLDYEKAIELRDMIFELRETK